jgi:hypothetical protein
MVLREPLEQESQLLAPKFTAVGLGAVHHHPGAQHRLIAADRKSKSTNELPLDGPLEGCSLLASLHLVYFTPGSKPFIAPDVRVSCLGLIRRTLAVASWRPQPFGGQQQRALWVLGSMALGGPRTLRLYSFARDPLFRFLVCCNPAAVLCSPPPLLSSPLARGESTEPTNRFFYHTHLSSPPPLALPRGCPCS